MHYDDRDNLVEQTHFDEQGQPTQNTDGVVTIKQRYDERGLVTEWSFLDERGRLVRQRSKGAAKVTFDYDDYGNTIESAYFDEQGQPVRNQSGYARINRQFDERDNLVEKAYFDEQGKSVRPLSGGGAKVIDIYNEVNEVVRICQYDEEGQLLKPGTTGNVLVFGETFVVKLGKTIKEIIPDGQAAKLGDYGLKPGDVVESYEGVPIQNGEQLIKLVSKPGEGSRELVVLRGDKRLTFHFAPGKIGIELTAEVPTNDPCPIKN